MINRLQAWRHRLLLFLLDGRLPDNRMTMKLIDTTDVCFSLQNKTATKKKETVQRKITVVKSYLLCVFMLLIAP